MMKSKEEIEGLGNLYLINETRKWVGDDIPDVYTQDDIIKAVAWGYDEGFYDATKWHYPSKGEYPTSGWVLVALEVGLDRRRCVVIGEYHATLTSPEKKWWVHGKEEHHVIAWMPLPEPPKEDV